MTKQAFALVPLSLVSFTLLAIACTPPAETPPVRRPHTRLEAPALAPITSAVPAPPPSEAAASPTAVALDMVNTRSDAGWVRAAGEWADVPTHGEGADCVEDPG